MSTELREQWEQLYLPLRPLCTNDFIEGVYRQPRAKALEGYRYIEANPKTVSDLLVVDIDDANARAMALWEHEGMLPNVIVENPRNGHAHAVWALEESGDMPPASWKRTKRRNVVGLGRNCHLFETARTWAYREVRHHWGDSEGLRLAISAEAHEMNAELFPEPLAWSEVEQIAKSIHKWIVTQSRMWRDGPTVYEATFITVQSARGKKSGKARRETFELFASEEMT